MLRAKTPCSAISSTVPPRLSCQISRQPESKPFCAAHRLLCKSAHYNMQLCCQVDCNKLMLLSHRSTMPSWMILCTQQRLSASGYDTRWTDPERSRFASVHYLLESIKNAVFVSGNSCLMRLDHLSAARNAVISCVASSMHLRWKCCRALGNGWLPGSQPSQHCYGICSNGC